MVVGTSHVADMLDNADSADAKDPLIIVPRPDLKRLRDHPQASIDLRLGSWFSQSRQTRTGVLKVGSDEFTEPTTNFVPFGESFYLHPRAFVLAITLEWICLPGRLAAYVVGKSSWGRAGLVIATAIGVHPGYKGCLTLELSNLGDMPMELRPGMPICQLFLHRVEVTGAVTADTSSLGASRRPRFLPIPFDDIAKKLSAPPA